MWVVSGNEFGSESGQYMVTNKALYGLKNSGAAFSAHVSEMLDTVGYKTRYADTGVYIHPSVNPYGIEYYE